MFVPGPRPGPHTLPCPLSPLPRRCGQWQGQAREGIPEHRMHPLVPPTHDSEASRISNELMKLPIPTAVLHVATTESSRYISPVSSSIDAKLDRNVPQHRIYPSVPRARDSEASRVSNELMKLPVPTAVPHVVTMESSWYILPAQLFSIFLQWPMT